MIMRGIIIVVVLAFCLHIAAIFVIGAPGDLHKIMGGDVTTISQYPTIAALLYSWDMITYNQQCGGIIINDRALLTAAHCPIDDIFNRWRVRVGSSYHSSGGVVYSFSFVYIHPEFDRRTLDNDIAVMRTSSNIVFVRDTVQPAVIAGGRYNLFDNEEVWAAGWGTDTINGPPSHQLRHVQIWTINQDICIERYSTRGDLVTANMLCSGWLDVGGRDQCQGDSGGPLYHNNVLVGICSWGFHCGLPFFPGVNTRVSRYTAWIQTTA